MTLEANVRYSGAWQEISARIQARDRVLLSFIALTSALVGLALSNQDLPFVGMAVGYLALATSLLTRNHDMIIGHLAAFMIKLAKSEKASPEWMTSNNMQCTLKERTVRDMAQGLFILFGAVAGLSIDIEVVKSDPCSMPAIVWYLSVLASIGALGILIWTNIKRREIHLEAMSEV